MLDCDENDLKAPIGRLYGQRSALLHGDVRAVDENQVARIRTLATSLLHKYLFGAVPDERVKEVREALLP